MIGKILGRILYIRFALAGIRTIFREELNIKAQAIYGVLLLVIAFLRGVSGTKIGILFFLFMAMLAVEMLNSVAERLCNFIKREFDEEIRKIKDIASGAVFVVGMIMFTGFFIYAMVFPQ